MEQRTAEWYQAKLGKIGASRIADLTATTKSGYSASRQNLMAELICERLTGVRQEGYTSAAMQWGIDNEPLAIAAYEFRHDVTVEEVGFILHPLFPDDAGASPDGRVGERGLVEIKCPNTNTHIETILAGKIPIQYYKQMQFQMACDKKDWCDFVSFDPRMPAKLQYFEKRIERHDGIVDDIEKEIIKFIGEMKTKIEQLERMAA